MDPAHIQPILDIEFAVAVIADLPDLVKKAMWLEFHIFLSKLP